MSRICVGLLTLLLWTSVQAGTLEARVVAPDGRPVEDVAVIAEPATGPAAPLRSRRTVAIEQREGEFVPYLTVVQTGTSVEFPNRDPVKHHVYSFSPAKHFEIKLYSGKPSQPVLFDKPGEVALGCNIHDWMEAYVLVVDSAYFAKTGSDGRAVLHGLPAGSYRLRVWHPRQKTEAPRREVRLGTATLRSELVLDVTPRPARPKPPLEPDRY